MKNGLHIVCVITLLAGLGCAAKSPKGDLAGGMSNAQSKSSGSLISGENETSANHGNTYGLAAIYFDLDQYHLREDARKTLETNAAILGKNADLTILIEGHCDERGTVEYNLALGEKRARAAREYLVRLGVESSRIAVISYGEERPASTGHDEHSWALNRRSEFVQR